MRFRHVGPSGSSEEMKGESGNAVMASCLCVLYDRSKALSEERLRIYIICGSGITYLSIHHVPSVNKINGFLFILKCHY